MRKAIAIAAITGSMALAGCSSGGTTLNAEAEVGGMTISVPSEWNETDHGGTTTFDGPQNEDGSVRDAIIVNHEDAAGQTIDSYASDTYNDAEKLRSTEVDGSECHIYDFDGTNVAIIEANGTIYDIMVLGDEVDIDDVLSSVNFDS